MNTENVSPHSEKTKDSQESDTVPFKLHWVFGHDTKVSPINISSSTIKGIFFCSGAVAVCYDWVKRTQTMLHGHVHPIVSMTATSDKTFLVSADSGPKNSLIVWHRRTGNCHYGTGKGKRNIQTACSTLTRKIVFSILQPFIIKILVILLLVAKKMYTFSKCMKEK